MEMQEWSEYVNRVATCDYPIPSNFINNYDDWHCRSIVGRMLFILKDIEGAMRVLSTVRDIKVDIEHRPKLGLSDPEHKCLCLRDLGEIIWLLTQNAEAALSYFDRAYDICKRYQYSFIAVKRGEIWARRLEILRACGRTEEALAECRTSMAEQNREDKLNQILFYGNKFLAETFAEQEEFGKAAACLAAGYKYFPLSAAGERDIAEAEGLADARERYTRYMQCTGIQYLPWEDTDTPTLEDVRRLQDENYRKRQEQGATAERSNLSFNPEEFAEAKEE